MYKEANALRSFFSLMRGAVNYLFLCRASAARIEQTIQKSSALCAPKVPSRLGVDFHQLQGIARNSPALKFVLRACCGHKNWWNVWHLSKEGATI